MPKPIRIFCLVVGALLVLAARANAATLTLAWDANTETDVTGYYVVYGIVPGTNTPPSIRGIPPSSRSRASRTDRPTISRSRPTTAPGK
jgi:hypothetical protein